VPIIRPTREHAQWTGTKSVSWDKPTISSYDASLIATNHASVNYQELADWSPIIVDTRNAMVNIKTRQGQVWKS
jgi:UDP-N-acetyl-D-glucosamine dehydrogenase